MLKLLKRLLRFCWPKTKNVVDWETLKKTPILNRRFATFYDEFAKIDKAGEDAIRAAHKRLKPRKPLDHSDPYQKFIADCHKQAAQQDTSSDKIKDYVNPEGIIGHAHVVKGPIGKNIDIGSIRDFEKFETFNCSKCGAGLISRCGARNVGEEGLCPGCKRGQFNVFEKSQKSSLPKFCPRCNGLTKISNVDRRVVACIPCGLAFINQECWNDPNFQAEMAHHKMGIKLEESKDVE